MKRRFGVFSILVALLFAACGGDDQDPTGGRASASPSPAPTPCTVADGSTEPQRSQKTPETAPITDVRYSTDGCPRIVFEFQDHEPDYVVQYSDGPFSECGSGEPVSTDAWGAEAFLTIRLEPSATADLTKESAPPTYDGPRDISVKGDVLKHIRLICDFEAVVEWVVGLDSERDFTVFALSEPPRIGIDISEQ